MKTFYLKAVANKTFVSLVNSNYIWLPNQQNLAPSFSTFLLHTFFSVDSNSERSNWKRLPRSFDQCHSLLLYMAKLVLRKTKDVKD